MGILPVVNCADFACVKQKIEALKTFLPQGSFLHCDIADAIFTFHKTWNNPTEWASLRVPYQLELHLMVEHPEHEIEPWIAAGARRFIVHIEAVNDDSLMKIFDLCDKRGVGVAIASNPETTIDRLATHLKHFPMIQVLCVHPGLAGQVFLPFMVEKIQWLRKAYPHAIIEVDGGMNPDTARMVKAAGADLIVSANYIFGDADPQKAYEALKNI